MSSDEKPAPADGIGRYNRPDTGQDQNHGNPSPVLPADQGPPAACTGRAGASRVPTVDDLAQLNRAIHDDDGRPESYALDQRSPLLSCLTRAHDAYDASPEGAIRAAAMLAHGIAQAQAFRDGNRRTAYFATQAYLALHGLGYLSAVDDDMLTRKLNQVVERQSGRSHGTPPSVANFEELFLRRLKDRRPPTAHNRSD